MNKMSFTEHSMVFSKATQGEVYVAPNFQVKEFACSDGSDVVVIHPYIPQICQAVRNKFNMPFSPNSAYRTITHNKVVGGAKNSNHIYGRAVDIPCKNGVTPKELYDYVNTLLGDQCELGIYSWGIHVGIQDTKNRFTDISYKW